MMNGDPYSEEHDVDDPKSAQKWDKKKIIILAAIIAAACVILIIVFNPFSSDRSGGANDGDGGDYDLAVESGKDYYRINRDRVPSVKKILGEEREITGISESASGEAETMIIEYTVDGNQRAEMEKYADTLVGEYGYTDLTNDRLDYDGSINTFFELARELYAKPSDEDGFLILLGLDYYNNGYTIMLMRTPGTLSGTTVPDVVGLYEDEAKAIIADAGFKVKVEYEAISLPEDSMTEFDWESIGEEVFDVGQVMEQDPMGGEKAERGSVVTIVVASLPVDDPDELAGLKSVPKIVGMSKSDAVSAILAAGFKEGKVTNENSDTVPAGKVISQSPKSGELAPVDSTINFVISLGPKATAAMTVPDVLGMTEAAAIKAINATKLQYVVEYWYSASAAKGTVSGQVPAAGAAYREGDVIRVLVSLGKVPNVIGDTVAQATAKLSAVGLSIYTNAADAKVTNDPNLDGKIAEQTIEGIQPGGEVWCVVWKYVP